MGGMLTRRIFVCLRYWHEFWCREIICLDVRTGRALGYFEGLSRCLSSCSLSFCKVIVVEELWSLHGKFESDINLNCRLVTNIFASMSRVSVLASCMNQRQQLLMRCVPYAWIKNGVKMDGMLTRRIFVRLCNTGASSNVARSFASM